MSTDHNQNSNSLVPSLADLEDDYASAVIVDNTVPIPTGEYIVTIIKFALEMTKGNNERAPERKLAWHFKIISPETAIVKNLVDGDTVVKTAGRVLFKNNLFRDKAQLEYLKTDLFKAGEPIASIRELEQTAVRERFLDINLRVYVETKLDSTGRSNSNVYIRERLSNIEAGAPSVDSLLPVSAVKDNDIPF